MHKYILYKIYIYYKYTVNVSICFDSQNNNQITYIVGLNV